MTNVTAEAQHVNLSLAVYVLMTRKQGTKSVTQFKHELEELALKCQFDIKPYTMERAVKDAYLLGTSDDDLRREALERDFDITQLTDTALGHEQARNPSCPSPITGNEEVSEICTKQEEYRCIFCDKKFHRKGSLNNHIRSKHDGEKPGPMTALEKVVPAREEMDQGHYDSDTDTGEVMGVDVAQGSDTETRGFDIMSESVSDATVGKSKGARKKYTYDLLCHICGKRFKKHGSRIRCIRSHAGVQNHQCPYCDKKFIEKSSLTLHLRVHTGEKPYQCEECGKTFSQCSGLINHRLVHTKEKPFKCDLCDKAFGTGKRFKIHRRTHTGEKPHVCDQCGRAFSDPCHLLRHVRSHSRVDFKPRPYRRPNGSRTSTGIH